jgi:ferredoxin/flavodoxin
MTIVIYYFSGTGNSLYVARDVAEATGGILTPIASLVKQEIISPDADGTGIIFPVYYGDLPKIIREFAGKLENIEDKYIFAVCTFGGSAGDSLKTLRSIINSRGGELAATYAIHMPQNAFYKFWEKHEPLYRNWRKKVKKVAINTAAKRRGAFFRNYLFDIIFKAIQVYVAPKYKPAFIKLSGASPELSLDELIQLNDTSFSVTDKCTGCGLCVKVCPVDNIELVEKKPVWQHHCQNCLACYNFCPFRAIRSGIAAKNYFYRHPDINTKEIIGQKKA